jgi:hypothetical protein
MDTGGFFRRNKEAGLETDHSPLSSAEVKKGGAVSPFPHMSLWHIHHHHWLDSPVWALAFFRASASLLYPSPHSPLGFCHFVVG